MKRLFALMILSILMLAACGQETEDQADDKQTNGGDNKEEVTLKVASLIPPMTEILELVAPQLKEEGIHLEMVVLSDNVQPNTALAAKEVDANFFNMCLIWKSTIVVMMRI